MQQPLCGFYQLVPCFKIAVVRRRFSLKNKHDYSPDTNACLPLACPAAKGPRVEFNCGSRTCKPNSVRRIAPARRSFLWAAHCCAALATYPKVVTHRAGTCPQPDSREPRRKLPSYLVLLRVGFALPAALLPRRCAFTAPFHPYPVVLVRPRSRGEDSPERRGGIFSVALSVERA
jgi:hypothetical protein